MSLVFVSLVLIVGFIFNRFEKESSGDSFLILRECRIIKTVARQYVISMKKLKGWGIRVTNMLRISIINHNLLKVSNVEISIVQFAISTLMLYLFFNKKLSVKLLLQSYT